MTPLFAPPKFPLWTNKDCEELGWIAPSSWQAEGVSIDTRSLQPGDLYIAFKGPHFDGNDFIEEAFRKNAAAAIAQAQPAHPSKPVIYVKDGLTALHALADRARIRSRARIIAITGSVGKTGTKEMLRSLLQTSGFCHAANMSYNNHIGVPLTLARLPREADYAVFEIGTNHPGEIAPLAQMVKPHVALITTIENVHTEHFINSEAIADEKIQIATGIENKGTVILPHDNPHFARMQNYIQNQTSHRIMTFGTHAEASACLRDIELHDDFSYVTARILGRGYRYKLSIPGQHIAINSLAALLGVYACGADLDRAIDVLRMLQPYEGRGARHKLFNDRVAIELIDESYNASPVAVRAAIQVLGNIKNKGRKIVCLGDMLELGDRSAELHRDLLPVLEENKIDLVFTCGALMQNLADSLPGSIKGRHYPDSKTMAADIANHIQDGDTILIKGSAGAKMKIVLDAFLNQFERVKNAV